MCIGEAIDAAIEYHIDNTKDEYKDLLAARYRSNYIEAHEEVKSLFNSSSIRGTTRAYSDGLGGNIEGRRNDIYHGGVRNDQNYNQNQGSEESDDRSRNGSGNRNNDLYEDNNEGHRVGSSGVKNRENKNKNYRNESTKSVVDSLSKEETQKTHEIRDNRIVEESHGNRNSERTRDRDKQFQNNEKDRIIAPISMGRNVGVGSAQNHRYDQKTDYDGSDSDSDGGYHGVTDSTHRNNAGNNNNTNNNKNDNRAADSAKSGENRNSENSFGSSSQNSSRTTEPRTYDAKKTIARTDSPAPYGSDTSERHQNNHQNLTEENAVDNYTKSSGKIKRNSNSDVENNRNREGTVNKNNQNSDSERRYEDSRRPESVKYGNDEVKDLKSTGNKNQNTDSSTILNRNDSADISENNEEEEMRKQIEQMYGTNCNMSSSSRRIVGGNGVGGDISPPGDVDSRSSGHSSQRQNHGNGDNTVIGDKVDGHSSGNSTKNSHSNKSNKIDNYNSNNDSKNNSDDNNNNSDDDYNANISVAGRKTVNSINENDTKDNLKSEKSVKVGNKNTENTEFSSIKERSQDGDTNQVHENIDLSASSVPPLPPPLPLSNNTVVSSGKIFYLFLF